MNKYSSFGLIMVIVVFGVLFIPKIINRIANQTQVQDNRSAPAKPLAYIKLNGEAKKVPEFFMLNQDSLFICLLYTSPSPRDVEESRMPSSA